MGFVMGASLEAIGKPEFVLCFCECESWGVDHVMRENQLLGAKAWLGFGLRVASRVKVRQVRVTRSIHKKSRLAQQTRTEHGSY
jgi:hypothetical protein